MYRRAIALDPNYALAYAGLSDCSIFRAQDQSGGPEAVAQAEASSKRALELDPASAEAHASRGLTLAHQKKHEEAGKEFEEAMRLDPTLYEAHVALDHVERALDLGFAHKEWYLTDSDLENVRGLPRFKQLIEEYFSKKD